MATVVSTSNPIYKVVPGRYRCIACCHTPKEWQKFGAEQELCSCCVQGHCTNCCQPNHECWCCSTCGTYPCVCEVAAEVKQAKAKTAKWNLNEVHKKGTFRSTPPWVHRGFRVTVEDTLQLQSWEEAWPLCVDGPREHDPCQDAADFYLLDAMQHKVLNREHECNNQPCLHHVGFMLDEHLDMIARLAGSMRRELIDQLDPLFQQYVEMACGGELRHHGAMGGSVISSTRRTAWAGWRVLRQIVGVQAIADMADMFYDWGEGGSYGGPLWAKGAEFLYQRITGQMPADIWVDRVFTLVHNGGCFLNKLDWIVKNNRGWSCEQLQHKVLPAQAADAWSTLLAVCSPEVRAMWNDYWRYSNRARVRAHMPPVPNALHHHKTRKMCRHCYSNPERGHLLICHAYTKKILPLEPKYIMSVDEEDWSEWNWSTWLKPDYPVNPDGSLNMLPEMKLGVQLILQGHTSVQQFHFNMTIEKLVGGQLKVADLFDPKQWSTSDPGPFLWRVHIYHGDTLLGSVLPKPLTTTAKLKSVVLDFGLLLPVAIPDTDWTKVLSPTGMLIHA